MYVLHLLNGFPSHKPWNLFKAGRLISGSGGGSSGARGSGNRNASNITGDKENQPPNSKLKDPNEYLCFAHLFNQP